LAAVKRSSTQDTEVASKGHSITFLSLWSTVNCVNWTFTNAWCSLHNRMSFSSLSAPLKTLLSRCHA
jgi:hypothetical protein